MSNPRQYELRIFDQTLIEFSISDAVFAPEIQLDDYDEKSKHLMPCGIALTSDGIWNWLEVRSIPANRKNAAQICRELGFSFGDTEALYRVSMGLSLNDSYWVVPRGFKGKFEDYNLYENPFSEAIGALAVSGEATGGGLVGNTPELTTDGTLRKGWRIIEGTRVLYKGASEGFVPGEPTSEYVASLVARDMGIDAVSYGIDTWQGEQCSTCECFASKDISYVPFAVATGITDMAGALWWFAQMGEDSFEAFCSILVFDALVCNTDRHFTNFGLLRNNHTGQLVGLAPMFDNGRALFPDVAEDSIEQFTMESQLRRPSFGGSSFEEQLARCLGSQQLELLNWARERGIVGNALVPGRRVAVLDAFLRNRAKELGQIDVVDHGELIGQLEKAVGRRMPKEDGILRLEMTHAQGVR